MKSILFSGQENGEDVSNPAIDFARLNAMIHSFSLLRQAESL